jgi:hypothetical protein
MTHSVIFISVITVNKTLKQFSVVFVEWMWWFASGDDYECDLVSPIDSGMPTGG